MYACMYGIYYFVLYSTASIHTSRNVWSGLFTDDVQLLHKIFLIYDQCTYSPLLPNTDDFIFASRSKYIYLALLYDELHIKTYTIPYKLCIHLLFVLVRSCMHWMGRLCNNSVCMMSAARLHGSNMGDGDGQAF